MTNGYKHANFLKNMKGIPKHWFVYKSSMFGKDMRFANLETHKDLIISPIYTKGDSSYGKGNDYVHVIYGGGGIKVLKNIKSAKRFAKSYMRKH